MANRQIQAMMWAEACEAMERAERLRRQFFHRGGAAQSWEAPVDVYESEAALIIVVALPGVAANDIEVALDGAVLTITGESPIAAEARSARIVRMEIPHGHFERRIELPPVPYELSGRHLANGCLMLRLLKL
jgi:HSP20 family protein